LLAIVVAAKEFRATLADEKEQGEDRSARAKNPKADKTSKPRKGTKEGKGASNPMYMYADMDFVFEDSADSGGED
jgi:hypothetical protein